MSVDPASSAADLGARPEVVTRVGRLLGIRRGPLDRPFLSAILLVTLLSIGARAVAAAKDLFVAQRFGISDELDAFIVASLVPTSILYAFSASAADAFLPALVRARTGDPTLVGRLLGSTVALTAGGLVAVAIALAIVARWIVAVVGAGFDVAKAEFTTLLFLGLLPTLAIGGWSAVWPALLNVSGRQAVTAATPLVTPTVTIVLLVFASSVWGVGALVAGAVAGAALEAVILGAVLVRLGCSVVPKWGGYDLATRDFARQAAALTLAALIAIGSALIDQAMAGSLGSGAVSAFSYAAKVLVLLTGIAGIVLTLVVLPRLALLVQQGDVPVLQRTFATYLAASVVLGSLGAVALASWSRELVATLFERGSFGASDVAVVAPIQALLALQLPFTLANLLVIRLLVALTAARPIVLATIANVGLHYAGNVVLIPVMGVNGIALSGTIASAILFGVFVVIAVRRLAGGMRAPSRSRP